MKSSPAARADFDAPLEWKLAAPGNTEHFSAVCYYFVRELQKTIVADGQPVPQGIIHASWGGSRIEPWMSERALRAQPGYTSALDLLATYHADRSRALRQWGDIWQAWWVAQPATRGSQPWHLPSI